MDREKREDYPLVQKKEKIEMRELTIS